MRRALAPVVLLAVAACGSSGGGAGRALRDTADNLGDIRSARLDLRLTAESAGAKGAVGFAMSGPFALPKTEGLPVADVHVTELRGSRESTVQFVSTGTEAYVVRDGRATRLPGGVSVGGAGAGLGVLRIDRWLRDPRLVDGDDGTDRVTAGLDVARAFDDLGRLGERLGVRALGGLRPLDDAAKAALAKAATDSSIEVWTGTGDRLLRRLVLTVRLAAGGGLPAELRALAPVTLRLSLALADVNEPVRVDAPAT